MYTKIINLDDIDSDKAHMIDYIAISALHYAEYHNKQELIDYIIESIIYFKIELATTQKSGELYYNNFLKPRLVDIKIKPEKSGGSLHEFVNEFYLPKSLCHGINILKNNNLKKNSKYKDVEKFNQLLTNSLNNLKVIVEKNNKNINISIPRIIEFFNNESSDEHYVAVENNRLLDKITIKVEKFYLKIKKKLDLIDEKLDSENRKLILSDLIASLILIIPLFLQMNTDLFHLKNPRDISFYIIKDTIIIIYFLSLFLFILLYKFKNIKLLSLIILKNKTVINIFNFMDRWLEKGIKGTLIALIGCMCIKIMANIDTYYTNIVFNYIKELGSTISATSKYIVFEPVKIIGFDFIKIPYFIFYFSELIRDFYIVLVIMSFIILYTTNLYKHIVLNISLTVSIIIFSFVVLNYEEVEPKLILLNELKTESKHEIEIKYDLLNRLIKLDNEKVIIQIYKPTIDKEKKGLISIYHDNITIIHPDSLFCKLRNYNLSNSKDNDIPLFKDNALKNIVNFMDINITQNKNIVNSYNIEINSQTENINIKNAYLEYDENLLHFKTLKNDTFVYLECKSSMYSLYYNKIKVAVEDYDFKIDKRLFFLPTTDSYNTYRGMNINNSNPFKCNQSTALKVTKTNPFCTNLNQYYDKYIEIMRKSMSND